MHRELNTKEEIKKRLTYLVYVICCWGGFFFALRGIMGERPREILLASLLAGAAYLLKRIGKKRWEFSRLARSFPMGSREDLLSDHHKREMRRLLVKFRQSGDWMERMEIRRRLEELVRREPLLLDAYKTELHEIHPTLSRTLIQGQP